MSRHHAWKLVFASALVLSACSKSAPPTAPPTGDAPVLVARAPSPRAVGVPYDVEIWAQFDRALDRASVDSTTVFLKQDTRRVACAIQYEPITRRILLRPRAALELQKTYSVLISARIRAQDGAPLGAEIFWQFSTNSLRRLTYSQPPDGSLQGPYAALYWYGNGLVSTLITYEVYASTDSAAVAARSIPYLSRQGFLSVLPRTRWPSGSTVFWSVTAENTLTGERLNGSLARFRVYPADAPVDSMEISFQSYGATSSSRVQYCSASSLPIGPSYNSCMRWALNGTMPTLRLASARIQMALASGSTSGVQLAYAQADWSPCQMVFPGPPYAEVNGLLATSWNVDGINMSFQSDGLSSFIEAADRFASWYGLIIRAPGIASVATNITGYQPPKMIVTYYR